MHDYGVLQTRRGQRTAPAEGGSYQLVAPLGSILSIMVSGCNVVSLGKVENSSSQKASPHGNVLAEVSFAGSEMHFRVLRSVVFTEMNGGH